MKLKRGQRHKWSKSEQLVWCVYAIIALLFGFIFMSLSPQRFEIQPQLIPTAEYLQKFPEENKARTLVKQVSETNDSQYDVCFQNIDNVFFEPEQGQAWEMYIDGQLVRTLSSIRTVDGFWKCASHIYLSTGLHLVEYQNQKLNINQKWSLEVE